MAYREKDTKKWTAQWFETNVKWVRRKNAESVDLKQSEKHWSLNEVKS